MSTTTSMLRAEAHEALKGRVDKSGGYHVTTLDALVDDLQRAMKAVMPDDLRVSINECLPGIHFETFTPDGGPAIYVYYDPAIYEWDESRSTLTLIKRREDVAVATA